MVKKYDLTEQALDDELAELEARVAELEELITRILLSRPIKEV